ncbi:MAG TPA: class I SAM-dependent methyltransferase [Rhodocyclaceae bacterium]|nr:class I SAM-dependent methyltransferase [Rhodocyclaceae bacterium]
MSDVGFPVSESESACLTRADSCLVCGSASRKERFVQRGYPVFQCLECGLEYVSPTPSAQELAEFYDRNYAVSLELYASAHARNAARIAELERWQSRRGRLLEVGAAYGHSLSIARDRGWDVVGVELSPGAASYAREHFDLEVFCCDLTDAPLAAGSVDAVMMWHVLEHARDPRGQLRRVAEVLKRGGVLGIRVPNIDSFGARVAGQWWPWMCPPAHLWFFSRVTLPRLLGECGFEVLEVRTQRGDGNNIYQYALMWAGNALNELRWRVRPRAQRSAAQARASAPFDAAAAAPIVHAAEIPADPPAAAGMRAAPSGLLQRWLSFLRRAQPVTNALARRTRLVVEPFERRGWGDELVVYARRMA